MLQRLLSYYFPFLFVVTVLDVCRFTMPANGLQLGEVADFGAQMFSFAQKFNRRTAVEFSTKPAILPNCCYAPFLLSF